MYPFFENIAVTGLSGWVWDGKGVVYTMCIKMDFKGIHLCFLGLYEMCWINNSFKDCKILPLSPAQNTYYHWSIFLSDELTSHLPTTLLIL